MTSKKLKYSTYFDKITHGDSFFVIRASECATEMEQKAAICYSIMQAHWVFRHLSEQYAIPGFIFTGLDTFEGPIYRFDYRDKDIIGVKAQPGDNLFNLYSNLFDYIQRGWLPPKIQDWTPLAEKLMAEDVNNVFSE